MTVKQLKETLDKFPDDMPVATYFGINWVTKDDPNWILKHGHNKIILMIKKILNM